MAQGRISEAQLQQENDRLAEQVRAFSSCEHRRREAALWRDATPEERIAETWRLCDMVPWLRSLWPDNVQRRADEAEAMPAETLALLAKLL